MIKSDGVQLGLRKHPAIGWIGAFAEGQEDQCYDSTSREGMISHFTHRSGVKPLVMCQCISLSHTALHAVRSHISGAAARMNFQSCDCQKIWPAISLG